MTPDFGGLEDDILHMRDHGSSLLASVSSRLLGSSGRRGRGMRGAVRGREGDGGGGDNDAGDAARRRSSASTPPLLLPSGGPSARGRLRSRGGNVIQSASGGGGGGGGGADARSISPLTHRFVFELSGSVLTNKMTVFQVRIYIYIYIYIYIR